MEYTRSKLQNYWLTVAELENAHHRILLFSLTLLQSAWIPQNGDKPFLTFFSKLDKHQEHRTHSTGPAEILCLPETQHNKAVASDHPQLPNNSTVLSSPLNSDHSTSAPHSPDTSASSISTMYSEYTVFMASTTKRFDSYGFCEGT